MIQTIFSNARRKYVFAKLNRFKNSCVTAVCCALLLMSAVAAASAQTLKADYQFQGDLNSSVAGAPALANLAGTGAANSFAADTVDGYPRQTLRFSQNGGVSVGTSGLIPNGAYTIVMLFKFDTVSGYRRLVDFANRTSDNGAYIFDGRLENENTGNAPFQANSYIQVVVVRETTGRVRAYRDGGLRVDFSNDNGLFAITSANILRFFQDDGAEASAGNIARLRLYDAPLTSEQVRALDRVPAGGEIGAAELYFAGFRDGNGEVYRMNTDGAFQRRQTQTVNHNEALPSLSPNGQKIVFNNFDASTNQSQIYIGDSSGAAIPVRLTNTTTFYNEDPSWSPDGTKILFTRCAPANTPCDLYTMNADGTNQTNLTASTKTEARAGWSPDGTKIVFQSNPTAAGLYNLFIMNSDGTNVRQLTNSTNALDINSFAAFSPDGTKIAFVGRRNAATSADDDEIFLINADGSNLIQLTNNNLPNSLRPVWSPDGSNLAYYEVPTGFSTGEVYTMSSNGSNQMRRTFNSTLDYAFAWRAQTAVNRTPFDFDGDGKADIGVFRPSNGTWYARAVSSATYSSQPWGAANDKIVPADYDGDGKTDYAVWRESSGTWYVIRSRDGFASMQFGQSGDIPQPSDFNGDGRAEIAVWRPSNGTWYTFNLVNNQFNSQQWGALNDKPAVGDYDGDAKADFAVFRPANGTWYLLRSRDGYTSAQWGAAADVPVAADYDGDGKSDYAVFRPSNGTWYLSRSRDGFASQQWGISTDKPVPADYDGDGKADFAVFRGGVWFLLGSSSGYSSAAFGQADDVPVPNAFVP